MRIFIFVKIYENRIVFITNDVEEKAPEQIPYTPTRFLLLLLLLQDMHHFISLNFW